MNEQKLIQNVIEQIKEAQLKLGAEKEVIRLYFPALLVTCSHHLNHRF